MKGASFLAGLFIGLCVGGGVGLNVYQGTGSADLSVAAGMFTTCVVWPLFTIMFQK